MRYLSADISFEVKVNIFYTENEEIQVHRLFII